MLTHREECPTLSRQSRFRSSHPHASPAPLCLACECHSSRIHSASLYSCRAPARFTSEVTVQSVPKLPSRREGGREARGDGFLACGCHCPAEPSVCCLVWPALAAWDGEPGTLLTSWLLWARCMETVPGPTAGQSSRGFPDRKQGKKFSLGLFCPSA